MKPVPRKVVLKVLPIVLGLAALSLGASIVLTDPDPATLPRVRALARGYCRDAVDDVANRAARGPQVGRPGRDWDEMFDDSGYATAIRFSNPIADPASLAQIRNSVVGRGRRGIAYLEGKLASCLPAARRLRRRRPTSMCSSAHC